MSPARGGPAFPCAVCGGPVRRTSRGRREPNRLQILCARCRYRLYDYPRLCVGFVVHRNGSLLVLTRGHQPRRGAIDLPGGFLEAREDVETGARRELREETGLTLGPAEPLGRYWDVYDLPGFGEFPTLNFYFLGGWRSGTARAADDAADAHWVPLARLLEPGLDLAWRHMRRVFRDARKALGRS